MLVRGGESERAAATPTSPPLLHPPSPPPRAVYILTLVAELVSFHALRTADRAVNGVKYDCRLPSSAGPSEVDAENIGLGALV